MSPWYFLDIPDALPAAIVVMTDGLDTASKFRLEEVAEKTVQMVERGNGRHFKM